MTDTTKVINEILDLIENLDSIDYPLIDNKVKIIETEIAINTWSIKRELLRRVQLFGFNSETKKLEMLKQKLATPKEKYEKLKDGVGVYYYNDKKIAELGPEQMSMLYDYKLEVVNETINLIDELLNNDANSIDIDFDTNKELKICLLYDLGVIDYLQNKHLNFSNNQIAEIIEYLTKTPIKTGVTNKTLSNIQNRQLDITDKYEKQLATLRLKFKIR
jgi:hypothetical protein